MARQDMAHKEQKHQQNMRQAAQNQAIKFSQQMAKPPRSNK
jgi:hypothetical protein